MGRWNPVRRKQRGARQIERTVGEDVIGNSNQVRGDAKQMDPVFALVNESIPFLPIFILRFMKFNHS